jgi:hypothetical protein
MRHLDFTFGDMNERPPFHSLITRGAAFQFDQSNIPRIREEITSLIDNLSEIYLPIRKKQDEAEKKAKEAERRAKRIAKRKNPAEAFDNQQHSTVLGANVPVSSELDSRERNVAVDDSGVTKKKSEVGSNGISSLVKGLAEISVAVRNVQEEAKNIAQQNNPIDAVDSEKCTSRKGSMPISHENGERENEAESTSFEKTDSDDETVLLSDSDQLDTEVVEEHRTTSL